LALTFSCHRHRFPALKRSRETERTLQQSCV
jgi:hypothetical protein